MAPRCHWVSPIGNFNPKAMHITDYENFWFFITTSYFFYDRMWGVRLGNYFLSGDVERGGVGMYLSRVQRFFHELKISFYIAHQVLIMRVVVIKMWAWCENRGPCTMIEVQFFLPPAFKQEEVCLYMFAHILIRSSIPTWFYVYSCTLMRRS